MEQKRDSSGAIALEWAKGGIDCAKRAPGSDWCGGGSVMFPFCSKSVGSVNIAYERNKQRYQPHPSNL